MKCPKCQFENPNQMQFCGKCGTKLESICSECGFNNPAEFLFCGKCGAELQITGATPSIDFNQPQSYTPKFLADKILTTRSSIEGERKLVTVLFADVANYASMSEKLDPEEVHQIMDGCFKILMDEIHKYEGTINQFTGDGVMALFGAPVSHEDHAQRACYAALSIQNSMNDYGEKIKKETGVEFRIRIGINSGQVIVGSIGDDLRMDYTAVGDTTNLASRMETNTSPGTILLSKNTQRLVRDYFELNSLGMIEVKGKEEPQEAFELIKAGEVDTRMGASVSKGLTRFVGRKNSMATVMEAFETAKSGLGHILAVVGEAGVGKSRLLLEMRNRLSPDETVFLEGQCLHYGSSMAYLPILDILKSYFDIQEGDREYIIKKKIKERVVSLDEKLVSLLPPLQELLSLTVDDEQFTQLEPKVKRDKTFEALRDLLIQLSHDKPLVLAIEDLQWVDRTSEEFLDYLIGWLANSPILLILLYRPEYTHQWGSKSYYTRIGLNQLGTASSSDLIRAILEEGEAAPELKQLILDRAAGNPLFMEEFTHTLLENGSIEKRDDQYTLNRKPSEIEVPDTIQGIIAARMDRLEDNIKRTMQVASVIGRDFAFRILQTITGMHEELKSYLLNLQGLEFIYEKRLFPELEYIFKHALIQEVAYNSLLVKRRSEIHKRIGEAIESLYVDRLDEFYEMLAYHYLKSDDLDKAYQFLKLSGDKATKNYANHDAFRFYKEAIEVLNRLPETDENRKRQIHTSLLITPLVEVLGCPENSLQILQDAVRRSEEIGDMRNAAIFYSNIGKYYQIKGNSPGAIKYSAKGFEEAEKKEDIDLMVPIGFDLMTINFTYGDLKKAIEIAFKVIHMIEKTHRESDFFGLPYNACSQFYNQNAQYQSYIGKFKEARAMAEKALRIAKEIDHVLSIASAELYFSMTFFMKGDGKNAIKHAEEGLKYCIEGGFDFFLPMANMFLGMSYFFLEEFQSAREYAFRALQIQEDLGIQLFTSGVYIYLGMFETELGHFSDAQDYTEKALAFTQKNSERLWEGWALITLGRVLGKKEPAEFEKAEEYIRKGIDILDKLECRSILSWGYFFLGDLYNDMGRKDEAVRTLKIAEDMFKEMEMVYYLDKTQKLLESI